MSYVTDIENTALASTDFRRVLATGKYTQVVAMTLKPGEEIGSEVHEENDQVVVVVSGRGTAVTDGEKSDLPAGSLVLVDAGTEHNIINASEEPLVLYTVYGPPDHSPDTVHATKAEADADEEDEPPQES